MSLVIFNGPLTNVFQASRPFAVQSEQIVLDFLLTIANVAVPGTPGSIEWYLEHVATDPNAAGVWMRETAEEDVGNGDVRMPAVVRRFSATGSDAGLAEGVHARNAQFARVHAFARVQIRVAAGGADACQVVVTAPFADALISA